MYKVAVMGDYDSIYGFGALGLSVFAETDPEHASQTLKQIAHSGYGIIYITEELAVKIRPAIGEFKDMPLPSIILIPGVKGNTGDGIKGVKGSVEQAVGSDILFGSQK